jgi:hypothetical protein
MIRLATSTVYSSSTFIACVVVALMVTPISCSIMREALGQAPPVEREGAYALGATRRGMHDPHGRPTVRQGRGRPQVGEASRSATRPRPTRAAACLRFGTSRRQVVVNLSIRWFDH